MPRTLSALTLRGRGFLAAGLSALGCAIVLDQPPLVRIGAALLVLPLLCVVLLARQRLRLRLHRSVSPPRIQAGQSATVRLSLTNDGRTPTGALLLEEQVPAQVGTCPRFALEGVGHGWVRNLTYQVEAPVRGVYEIGPLRMRVTDPFGLVEVPRSFIGTETLTVTPRVLPLPDAPVGGTWLGSGDNRPRAFATGSAEDVTVREYRRGDDLRRVHWRSSAKSGELMVRREEQPWQSRATIYLDNRVRAHRGHGAGSSFEAAVTAAASVASHLAQRGYAIRLVTATETGHWHQRSSGADLSQLLDALAVVRLETAASQDLGWLTESGDGGLLVSVLGHLDAPGLAMTARMRQRCTTALALALDVEAWTVSDSGVSAPAAAAQAALARQGWRCVRLSPQTRLDAAWAELGRGHRLHRVG